MAKAELKTKRTEASVDAFIDGLEDEQVRDDCRTLVKLMSAATREPPKMWGTGIVGFGTVHLKYASGRELDWMLIGFGPRKTNLSIYLMDGYGGRAAQLKKPGKHSIGKSCLYVKRLADVDLKVLDEMIRSSVAGMKKG